MSARHLLSALCLLAILPSARAYADVPPLYVPVRPDSVTIQSEPAPLLVPGAGVGDTLRLSRAARARENYLKGRAFAGSGGVSSAMMSFLNALRLDSTLVGPHGGIGRLYAARGQWQPAAIHFGTELERDPGNREVAREFGLALAQLGDTARAIAQLQLLVRRDAKDEPAWQALGFAYGVAGRRAQAEHALRRALSLDAKDADAWRDLGVVLASSGRTTDAREAYRRAAALDRHDAGALVNLGNLEARAGRHAAALAAYRAAETRDSARAAGYQPASPSRALAFRGQLRELPALGRDAGRGAVYQRWVQAAPDDLAVRIEAMRFFERAGRLDIAVELGREGVRRAARSGEAWLALATALETNGDTRASVDALHRAEQWLPLPEQRRRAHEYVRHMRATAPDSLRAFFAADSIAHPFVVTDTSRSAARDVR